MSIESRLQLKTYFETGDIPLESQFINLLDSYFHLLDPNSGSLILTGSIDVSGSINATGTASFGFITSSLPSGSDDTVVILDNNNVFRQREIDSRVWGTTLLDGDNLTPHNVPQVKDSNTLQDSVIYSSQNTEIGINTGYSISHPAELTVSGNISASGWLKVDGVISASNISASGYVSASNVGAPIGTFTNVTASNYSASGYMSASMLGADISVTAPNFTASANISASGVITASAIDVADGNITNIGSVFLDTIESDNGSYLNHNADFSFFSGSIISNSPISTSQWISASHMGAAIGTFTNITSSNVSASGYVSASNLGAAIGTITNITSSNVSASGYVSASNVGGHTGSFGVINLAQRIQHTGDERTGVSYENGKIILGVSKNETTILGSINPSGLNSTKFNSLFSNTNLYIYASESVNSPNDYPIIETNALSGSVLIGNATLTNHTLVAIMGNLHLQGANGNLTASNISASGFVSASNLGAAIGTITNVTSSNVSASGYISSSLGHITYLDNTNTSNVTASGTISGAKVLAPSASFNHIDADTGSFTDILVENNIIHTGNTSTMITFNTDRITLGVTSGSIPAQIDIFHDNINLNNTLSPTNISIFGSGSFVPIIRTFASEHNVSINRFSSLVAPGISTEKPRLSVGGGIGTSGSDGYIVASSHISASGTSSAAHGFVETDFIAGKVIIGQHFYQNQGGYIPSASQANGTARLFVSGNGAGNVLMRVMDAQSKELLFVSGGVGIGTIEPQKELEVIGHISASENIYMKDTPISYPSESTVVVLEPTTGKLGTDEIDPKVWGHQLVSYVNNMPFSPLDNHIAVFTSQGIVEGDPLIRWDGNPPGTGPVLQLEGNLSASGWISASQFGGAIGYITDITSSNVSASLTGSFGHLFFHTLAGEHAHFSHLTSSNISASGYVSASNMGAAIATFTNITASNVSASGTGSFGSANVGRIVNNGLHGNLIIDGNGDDIVLNSTTQIANNADFDVLGTTATFSTSSGNNTAIIANGHIVSDTIVQAPIGLFTNITASNVSASGYVSASNIGASSIKTTHLTGSGNLRFTSGYISASMLGANVSVTAPNFTASANISASGTGSFGYLDIDNISFLTGAIQQITGSSITGSFTGSLLGTASWAHTAVLAITGNHALIAVSSSVAALSTTAHTASHAVTASHAITAITASHALITSNNPTNFKNTGRRIGNSAISGNLYITGGQGLLGNVATFGDVTASGRLVLGTSTEIYSGSMDGPNVIILHTTGGLTNFFAGAYAGASNVVEGEQNIGIGYEAANSLSTGDENTWIGYQAGKDSTIGDRNVAIGRSALENNVSGDGNIAIGYKAGENETGDNKLYIGNDANPVLIKGDMAIDEVKVYGLLAATHSISSSGHLFSSNSVSDNARHVVVVWDSGSGRYYHTGSYGGGGGGGVADHLGNHSASLKLFMNSQSIDDVNNITFHSSSTIHINHIGFSSSAHSNTLEFRDKIQKTIISGSVIKDTRTSYTNYIPPNYKLSVGLNGTPATPIANIHVKGDIWASGSNGNITASGFISGAKMVAATASFGTNLTNTTNIAGTALYVQGNASASGEIEAQDIVASRMVSSSLNLMSATGSFGTPTTNTTNPTDGGIQNVIYAHGNISSSNNIIAHNYTASGYYNLTTTNTKGSGSIFQAGKRILHTLGSSNLFLGEDAGNLSNPGSSNVGIGPESLQDLTIDGMSNTALGRQSLKLLRDGKFNTAIGAGVGANSVTGDGNTLVGYKVGSVLQQGKYNTIIGYNGGAGYGVVSESIAIGYDVGSGSSGMNSSIALGTKAGASNLTSSKMYLGNAHYRAQSETSPLSSDWFSLIEGEMDLAGNSSGSGRATVHQILRIFPTASFVKDQKDNNFVRSAGGIDARPGDMCVSGSGAEGTHHDLMFYNGIKWVNISLNGLGSGSAIA